MLSTPLSQSIAFRSATPNDCLHLVLFADMATRRLTSFLWEKAAAPGQSAFDVGRSIIRNDERHLTHFKNWRIVDQQDQVVGALNGYVIAETSSSDVPTTMEVLKPLNELKAMATGTWYISAAAIYTEYQGKGLGKALLAEAERIARKTALDRLTLMVGSFNQKAYGLYQRAGFMEWDRRPFSPFPGSDGPGEWILMVKSLS